MANTRVQFGERPPTPPLPLRSGPCGELLRKEVGHSNYMLSNPYTQPNYTLYFLHHLQAQDFLHHLQAWEVVEVETVVVEVETVVVQTLEAVEEVVQEVCQVPTY